MEKVNLHRALASDSEPLKIFYSNQTVGENINFRLIRKGTFFDQYRLQTDDYETFVLKKGSGKDSIIEGVGTLLFRKGLLNGQPQTIGYATDLRVSSSRDAITGWAQHFLPSLKNASHPRGCQYVFSVVPERFGAAYNALIRPRSARRNIPRFHLLKKFEIVCVHGTFPLARPLNTIRLRPAKLEDFDSVVAYLVRKSQMRPMAFPYSKDFLLDRFRKWPGFDLSNFILAFDFDNQLVGCVAPWESRAQSIEVGQYQGLSRTIKNGFFWGSLFGLTRRMPAEESQLGVSFLTHLYADNPDIFEALIMKALELRPHANLLCYPHFQGDLISLPPKSLVTTTYPLALYTLLAPEDDVPSFLKPGLLNPSPELELALL